MEKDKKSGRHTFHGVRQQIVNILNTSGLPPFLAEMMLQSVLADVRAIEIAELSRQLDEAMKDPSEEDVK